MNWGEELGYVFLKDYVEVALKYGSGTQNVLDIISTRKIILFGEKRVEVMQRFRL